MPTTYKVYRDGVVIASPTTSSYIDTDVTNDVTYGYKVSAVTDVEGPKSEVVYAKPTATPVATRPFPAPLTTQTMTIPATIDATGATDVTQKLRDFIRTVPSATIIEAPPGAIYKISGSILMGSAPAAADSPIKGKSHIIFDGKGATLNNTAGNASSTASNEKSTFYWSWLDKPFPTNITIRNWVSKNACPNPGHLVGSEFAAFAHIMGGSNYEITNITASGMWGDLVTVNEDAQHIWIHHNNVIDCGRNNSSIVWGSHILIEDNTFGKAGYCTFDIEPEPTQSGGITDVIFRRNKSGVWLNCYFALDGANSGKPISDIIIDGNQSTGETLLSVVGFSGSGVKTRPQRVTFTNNTGPSGSLKFSHIDTLVVKGNSSAPTLIDCTNVVTS